MSKRRRSWFFIAPVFWLIVYFAAFTLVVRLFNGHWSEEVLERFPSLARADAAQCQAEHDDPLTPANGSRVLGVAARPAADFAIVFVHGFHDSAAKWKRLVVELDHDFVLQDNKAVAFFPCFKTHDMSALEVGAAQIHESVMQVPPGIPIHLVGFSMGGLVVKNYLRHYAAEIDPARIDVITLNTPHHGVTSFFLGFITGDSSVVDMRMTADLDPLGTLYGDNALLSALNDPAVVSRFEFQTIAGSYVTSPVTAFLGGAWLSHSDGMVSSRSGHLRVPRLLDEDPDTFLDGMPYACGVDRPAGAGADRQVTFLRPLNEAGIFHSNLPNEPTAGRLVVELFRDELSRLGDDDCATTVELLDIDDHRSFALLMLAVPLVIIAGVGVALGRELRRPADGLAVSVYGTTVAVIAFTWSAAVPQELLRVLQHGHVSGVTLAVIGAAVENAWAMPWFAYYLRHVRQFGDLTPRQVYASGLAFGLIVAMLGQMLFAWTTAAASREATMVRLLLCGIPRITIGWVMAWVFLERARLKALAISAGRQSWALPWARRLLLLLPAALHAIYSALIFHATGTLESLAIYALLTLVAIILMLLQRALTPPATA